MHCSAAHRRRRIAGKLLSLGVAALILASGLVPRALFANSQPPSSQPGLPDTPVGRQLIPTLDFLNAVQAGRELTQTDLSDRFTPALLGIIPPELMIGLIQQFAAPGPFTFQGFTRPPVPDQAVALLSAADAAPYALALSVETPAPNRISGLYIMPVPTPPGVDLQPYSPSSEPDRVDGLVDIGGRRLYGSCRGTGSPTVILESGLGDPAATWFGVESAVARFTRVCSYDRPNVLAGASDPVPTPRTGSQFAEELHALLQTAAIPGPYVLVGHSAGGHVVRLFAAEHPAEVAGLVLEEASHEDFDSRLESVLGPEFWPMYQALAAQAPNPEGLDFEATANEVRQARTARPLPAVPLVVVSRGQAPDPAAFPPGWPAQEMEQLWRELQEDLTRLAPGGRQVIAERSGHYVNQTEPDMIVAAIRDIVEASRGQPGG